MAGSAGTDLGDGENWMVSTHDETAWVLAACGHWDIEAAGPLGALVERLAGEALGGTAGRRVRLDLSGLVALDTVGALLLFRLRRELAEAGGSVAVVRAKPAHLALLDAVWRAAELPAPVRRRTSAVGDFLFRIGKGASDIGHAAVELIAFFGVICVTLGRIVIQPRRIRGKALIYHIEHTGLHAVPILGLLLFLIGVVLAYQGAEQLRKVGAEIFVVNLLGLSVLREIGPLVTAIIVAGRSGSAFTAQIGTMKVNQEVDAMLTLGLDPVELLVVPRMLALMVALPLLTFFANMVALAGGSLMAYLLLDISAGQFIAQLQVGPLDVYDVLVGMLKTPVFAVVIAMVGCHEGLQVTGSAESVGSRTTQSVVESIFLVIVLNALFSILFSFLRF
ncbi:MAG: MlaE family lipid ABC transporter permease subunit [Azospirillum sp.]|nr:MlaE family lipid ABC transporter permease subunit [Azospirillum sp.]